MTNGASFRVPLFAVLCIAIYFCFFRLGADRLGLDEGHYASATRNLLGSDDWLTVTPYQGHTYFQKPPLYMWLSAPLARLAPNELWPYRAVSALFGVVAIVATAWVGNALTGRTVGVAAGLMMATNRDFLLYHGARDGTMDAGLTCFTILVVGLACNRTSTAWRWALIGACCGVMSMLKPFVGVPLLIIVAIAFVASDRSTPFRRHLARLALAATVMLVVALPWYVACTYRYGQPFLDEIIGRNVVGRIVEGTSGNVQGPFFYVAAILSSSPFFLLALPAIAYGIWMARRHDRRWWVIVAVGLGLPLLYSLSRAKVTHYLYPAFPSLCILVALLIVHGLRFGLTRSHRPQWFRPIITATFGLLVAVQAMLLYLHTTEQRQYRPWEIYQTLRPAIDSGHVAVRFTGFPSDPIEWPALLRLEADDIFWLTAIRVAANQPASDTIPTLIITNRMATSAADLETLLRGADARLRHEDGQVIAALINPDPLLRPSFTASETSDPLVRVLNPDHQFTQQIRCEVRVLLRGRATLHVELAPADGAPLPEIHYRATLAGKRIGRGLASPTMAGRHVAIELERSETNGDAALVTIDLSPDVRGRVVSARVVMEP